MSFGKKIKYLREKNNLTQSTIANFIGVKINTYSQYENELRTPNYETVKILSKYFKVSTDYLLDDEFDTDFALVDYYLNEIKMTTLRLVKLMAFTKEKLDEFDQGKLERYHRTVVEQYERLNKLQEYVKHALGLLGIDDNIIDDYSIF